LSSIIFRLVACRLMLVTDPRSHWWCTHLDAKAYNEIRDQ